MNLVFSPPGVGGPNRNLTLVRKSIFPFTLEYIAWVCKYGTRLTSVYRGVSGREVCGGGGGGGGGEGKCYFVIEGGWCPSLDLM